MTMPVRRSRRYLLLRASPGWLGRIGGARPRLAAFAETIQARYGAASWKARRVPLVFLRSRLADGSYYSHHDHRHLHSVLSRYSVVRWDQPRSSLPPPSVARPPQSPMRAEGIAFALPRPVAGTVRPVPVLSPPLIDVARRTGSAAAAGTSRSESQTAATRVGRFTPRMAPAGQVPAVPRVSVVGAAYEPSRRAPEPAGAAADAIPQRAPAAVPDPPLVGTSPGISHAVPLDLDLVTGEVLRRIERRALAQRERLGRAAF